jgi:hypothetical protein
MRRPALSAFSASLSRALRRSRSSAALVLLGGFAASDTAAAPAAPQAQSPKTAVTTHYVAKTSATMAAAAVARATDKSATEFDILTAALTVHNLGSGLPRGGERTALESIASAPSGGEVALEMRRDVGLLARAAAPDEGTDAGVDANKKLGIVTDLALLGPFRDSGGGFATPLGPEQGQRFADARADYSWGSYEVRWRTVPPRYAVAEGVPLDLFIAPRKESCSFVATKLTVDRARPIVVRLATSGQAALFFDGAELGRSDEVHESAFFDRLAGRVEAEAGDHLVVAKVCSAALSDDGRVRLRVTDENGAPAVLPASANLVQPTAKPKVRPMPTALARVAGATANGTTTLLGAIVARTLGGADDLKSPRAQGLLDTLTQDRALDADRTAFAAWVTPSAPNRTGLYGRTLARTDADRDTTDFVRRQVIRERQRAQMNDWAYAGLQGAGIDRDDDDDAVLLRAQVALGAPAIQHRAFDALMARFGNRLDQAPTSVLLSLRSFSFAFDRPLGLKIENALAARGYLGSGTIDAISTYDPQRVRAAARALFAGRLDEPSEGVSAAQTLSRVGFGAEAHELLAELALWAPNDSEVLSALADATFADPVSPNDPRRRPIPGDGRTPEERHQHAIAVLARARELAPGEARLRAEMSLRRPKTTTAQPDERYLLPSETILKRRGSPPKPGEAPDVRERQLHWLRAVRKHPDKRVSQLIHYAREIVIGPRSQDELYENLPLEGDLIEILRARVHRRDGSVVLPLEEHNEGTRPRIRWPELSPGDTVEVAIRTWTAGPVGGRGDPPFYFLDYSGSFATAPLLYNEVIVESDKTNPVYVDVVGAPPDRRDERDEQGTHVVHLIWDKPKMVPDEPLAPHLTELVPVVVGSTFRDWSDFRAWYSEAVRGFTEPDAEVRRLAAELTKGKTTRDAKLKALFEFVSDQIRYVNYTSGEFWLPNRPHQLLARREGDCDDKAILLITLLRAVGIEAQEVLVQTRETGQPSVLRAKNAAAPLFDHGIAFLPGPNGGTYLDATSPQSRLGPLPAMDARGAALPMRPTGTPEIVQLPAGVPEDHGSDVDWTLTLTPNGGGEVRGTETHSGDSAFYLRTYLAQEGARSSYVEGNLLGPWLPTVEVAGPITFVGDMPGGKAKVSYHAKSDAVARREGTELVVPLAPNRTMASQLAPLVRRTLPVSLPSFMAPSRQRRFLRIVAPQGFAFGDLPAGGKVEGGEFGRAELEITPDPKDPRAIVARRSVTLDQSIIPVAKYEAWRTFLQRIDALMTKGVRLLPIRGGK